MSISYVCQVCYCPYLIRPQLSWGVRPQQTIGVRSRNRSAASQAPHSSAVLRLVKVPTVTSVRSDIVSAFRDAERPPLDDIAPHDCYRCAALRAALAPHVWETLPAAILEEFPTKLPLLSARGYAYFLPAYLLYALDHLTPDSMVAEFTLHDLAIRQFESDEDRDWHRARLRHVTRPQIEAMMQYLLLIEGDEAFRISFGDVGPSRQRLLDCWTNRWNS
jgi:hypothetical protein